MGFLNGKEQFYSGLESFSKSRRVPWYRAVLLSLNDGIVFCAIFANRELKPGLVLTWKLTKISKSLLGIPISETKSSPYTMCNCIVRLYNASMRQMWALLIGQLDPLQSRQKPIKLVFSYFSTNLGQWALMRPTDVSKSFASLISISKFILGKLLIESFSLWREL